ncbi:MAG: CBS domain-containing protein [Methanomicrobiales archaeon]|nr:CBS domain-containing protein [Methanomicrobiales archaeon]MDD1645330.1 CBS domain-containing protein [Methanomicrobiales archaeon]MDD1648617.1 CBS domain-containing protein [Methanomicrobiales archaeon]
MRFETRVPLREVMHTPPATIDAEASVAEAAAVMRREKVGSCIVLRKNLPIGIVTEEDFAWKVVAKDLKPGSVKVHEVMSSPLITITADKTVGDAAQLMVKKSVRRLPVVEKKKVVGIVTVRDILSATSEMNEIMAEMIAVNREDLVEMGVCGRCGRMSDDLRRVEDVMICPSCREEDRLT